MIFETERLLITKLSTDHLKGFYNLESDADVLKYADGRVKNFTECATELEDLIAQYRIKNSNYLIYAVLKKTDLQFIGTVALVKDNNDYEIGYRLQKRFWNLGYGLELCKGLILYCKQLQLPKIVAYVVSKNEASVNILEALGFIRVFTSTDIKTNLLEYKYQLIL